MTGAKTRAYDTKREISGESVIIHSTMSVAAVALQKVLDIETEWKVQSTGEIFVNNAGEKRYGISAASKVWTSAIFKRRI